MTKRFLVFDLVLAAAAFGQKIETQKADRETITRLDTAMNHLTVIEVSEPVEQVAAGSSAFNVEWRGTKVFIEPLEPDATTNLFIWTKSGSRFSYELAPAGSVEDMHFAIDNQPPVVTVAKIQKPAAPVPVVEQPLIPPDMLFKSLPVRFVGTPSPRTRVEVLLRDLYKKDGKVYLRYAIRNDSAVAYEPGVPVVVSLKSPRSPQSLYAMRRTQLGGGVANQIRTKGQEEIDVVHSEVEAPTVEPGQEITGILAIAVPNGDHPHVLRFEFAGNKGQGVSAMLVL